MTSKAQISLAAASVIQRRKREGYRGVLVFADPTAQLFVIEILADGEIELRGVAPLPQDVAAPLGMFEFPDLDLEGKRGAEATAAVLEAIHTQAPAKLH